MDFNEKDLKGYGSIIISALGYFILLLDLISDFIPVAGYTDDLAALIAAVKAVNSSITPAIRARTQAKLVSSRFQHGGVA